MAHPPPTPPWAWHPTAPLPPLRTVHIREVVQAVPDPVTRVQALTATIEALKARLYAALKHDKACGCGECSGGLNAVDELASLAERAEAARAECRTLSNSAHANEHYFRRAEMAEARVVALTEALTEIEDGTTADRIGQYAYLRDWVNRTARAALAGVSRG